MPTALVAALKSRDCVAMLGADFLPGGASPSLAATLCGAVLRSSSSIPESDRPAAALLLASLENAGQGEAELLLGDACALLGRAGFQKQLRRAAPQRRGWRAPLPPPALRRRLDALADVPVTAVLAAAGGWDEALETCFPRRVGLNFGGFGGVLSKPRVDRPPGTSRPLLHLWPGLETLERGSASQRPPGPETLPESREDCENILAEKAPYPTFLCDVFRSKVVLLLGFRALPPAGHVGQALERAWRQTRSRDASRQEPLAFAFFPDADEDTRRACFDAYGLAVVSFEAGDLDRCLLALAGACGAGD